MRRAPLATIVALAGILGFAGTASADTSTSCLYERYWTEACGDAWVISIAEEDAANAADPKMWHADQAQQRMARPSPTVSTGRTYTVRRHDTLWRIAVRMYGPSQHAGHKWKVIAKANHLHGTSIRVGQVLRIPQR